MKVQYLERMSRLLLIPVSNRLLVLALTVAVLAAVIVSGGGGKAEASTQFPFVNIAASARGTVVRINVNSYQIVGEYSSAPDGMGKNPSRTTVDQNGATWVSNRAEGSPAVGGTPKGSVTRIGLIVGGTRVNCDGTANPAGQCINPAGSSTNTCQDRDGDTRIKTSTGLGNILPWTNALSADTNGGVSTAEDECIINYTRIAGTFARTVAIDSKNNVWTGGLVNRAHEKLDGSYPPGVTTGLTSATSGQPIAGTQFNINCGGYGGLVSPYLGQDILWSAQPLLRANVSGAVPVPACLGDTGRGNYGLGVDCNTGHIWYSSNGGTNRVYELDPANGAVLNSYPQGWGAQGVVVDRNSHVWVAETIGNEVLHLAPDPNNPGKHYEVGKVGGFAGTSGVAVDVNGNVWASEYNGNSASMIDPKGGAGPDSNGNFVGGIAATVSIGAGAYPYNYSDMTGLISTCITEPPSPGSITICKQTDPDSPLGNPGFTFDDSHNSSQFILHDNECSTIPTPSPGTYEITEQPQPGWTLTDIHCEKFPVPVPFVPYFVLTQDTSITINPAHGEQWTCTFTNAFTAPTVICGSETGLNIATGTSAIGSIDPIWVLTSAPSGALTAHRPAPDNEPPWVNPATTTATFYGAHWIHRDNAAESVPDVAGDYAYKTSFTIPSTAQSFSLGFQYSGDDDVTMGLSGGTGTNFLGISPAGGYATGASGSLHPSQSTFIILNFPLGTGPFDQHPGVYTLEALVHNNGGPTGLLVIGSVNCVNRPVGGVATLTVSDTGSPVPWTPLAAVAAGVMAVMGAGLWYGRRRWLR